MQKHLLGYRDNLRVEVELGIPIVARTVAELRALSTWPGPLVLDVHIDLEAQRDDGKGSAMICQCDTPRCVFPARPSYQGLTSILTCNRWP